MTITPAKTSPRYHSIPRRQASTALAILVGALMALGDQHMAVAQDEGAAVAAAAAAVEPSAPAKPSTSTDPVELTKVDGRLMLDAEKAASGGVAYFIFQRRLLEIPHQDGLAAVRAKAEAATAVGADGKFSLSMAPGNFALVYDPSADAASATPGDESFGKSKRPTREQVQARLAAIKANVGKGIPVADGKLAGADHPVYVVENRAVRPPAVDFTDIRLGDATAVKVAATDESGAPAKAAILRARAKSGDIAEPHPPTASAPGVFAFYGLSPQPYQVIALGSRPAPTAGAPATTSADSVTTPTVQNGDFVFDGDPLDWKVTLGPPAAQVDNAPPEPPAAPASAANAKPE